MKKKDIKILLVDDEPDILEIVGYNLKNEGYQVFTAKNGLEAIKMAKKTIVLNHDGVLISDIIFTVFVKNKIHYEFVFNKSLISDNNNSSLEGTAGTAGASASFFTTLSLELLSSIK